MVFGYGYENLCHPVLSFFRVNIWYIDVTCDDNFVFSFPRLLLLNKSKCTKSTVMYDPTYESRDITRSRNHVINHCRKLEMAYETPFIIFLNRTERNDSKWFKLVRLTGNRFRDDRKSRSTWSTWRSFLRYFGFVRLYNFEKPERFRPI